MLELPFLFMAGLVGSSHCLGMCGGFALAIGSGAPGLKNNLSRQLVYTLGRLFSYTVLGAAAGFGGWRLRAYAPSVVNLPATLAILAGALLVYQGLAAAGWLGRRGVTAANGPCLAGSFFGSFLRAPGRANVFLAGLFTGLLPCGLLYGMLALAASSREMTTGAATMAVFGMGTAPLMIATGCGGSALSFAARRHLFQIAAWCLVVTGVISIARGVGYLSFGGEVAGGCPFCQ